MKKSTFVLLFFSFSFLANAQDIKTVNSQADKFGSLLQLINYYYVDTVNTPKLTEEAIVAMLEKLDPHSIYISKNDLKAMNEPLEGNFEGIGVQFNILFDTITVVATIPGGPSEKVGIQAGDKIVKIDGNNVAGIKIKNEDVIKKLRGTKGTKVLVSMQRRGVTELLDFTITRDKIPLYSVDAVYMATPTVGYIKVNRFAQTTMDEFRAGLKKLKSAGMKDLILDLQDNGGGYLNMAFEMVDEFLNENKMIVYTEGIKSPRKSYSSTNKGGFEKGRLIVLVNEGSASASEIVSGAIQDWDRGLIIGRRTFGKGLVQNQYPLPDGSAVRLTIARYYTPVGRSIQRHYGEGTESYYKDLYGRFKHGELTNKDSIHFPDSLKYITPNKRIVYGGGGIMPDIFVGLDTTKNSTYFGSLIRKGVLNQFCFNYVDANRNELKKKYPDFATYKKNFIVDDVFLNNLVEAGEKEGVKKDDEALNKIKREIQIQIKAIIARDLWKSDEFYEVFNDLNEIYLKALETFKTDSFKKMGIVESK